jgi:hypothetical protein
MDRIFAKLPRHSLSNQPGDWVDAEILALAKKWDEQSLEPQRPAAEIENPVMIPQAGGEPSQENGAIRGRRRLVSPSRQLGIGREIEPGDPTLLTGIYYCAA